MLMVMSQTAGSAPAGSILSAMQGRSPEAVEPDPFDPTETRCWLTRGRSNEHASELARIWRAFPDLPATASLDDRMARGRERIAAMKPLNDAISAASEAERQARNFALMERHLEDGTIADRELAVLRGRDEHGYDWDIAVAYSDNDSGGSGGGLGSMFPGGLGFKQKVKASQTMLTLVEVKTGIQQAVATGSARKKDLSILGGGILTNTGIGALGGTYTSTDMGKITSLAMLDAFIKLTTQAQSRLTPAGGVPAAPAPAAPGSAVTAPTAAPRQ